MENLEKNAIFNSVSDIKVENRKKCEELSVLEWSDWYEWDWFIPNTLKIAITEKSTKAYSYTKYDYMLK